MGHAKQKMRKQHALNMWISALHFKTLFLSVKVENIYSMSNGGSRGGTRRARPPPLFLDQSLRPELSLRKIFFFRPGLLLFSGSGLSTPTSPPPPPPTLSEGLDVCSDIRRSCLNLTLSIPSNVPPLERVY